MKIELSGHYNYGRIVKTMLPIVAMMIVTSFYSIVDGLFISNFAGSTAFAAMNIIWPALAILSSIGLMLGSGGSALVAKIFGEGDEVRANQIFSMIVRLSLIIGLVIGIICFLFMRQIAIALGAEGEMIPLATMYGRIIVLSMPAYICQMEFQSFYMTAEKPQLGTIISIVCGFVNIGLDFLFVVLLDMGLMGAAIATAISLTVGGVYPILYFSSKRNKTQLKLVEFSNLDWKAIAKSCTNGLSEYVGNIAFNIVGIAYNLQLMKYIGEDGVSAYGVIMYVGFIFAAIFIGYNVGITQIIAYNYGAKNREELHSLLHKSFVLIGTAGIIITLISEVLAPYFAGFFVGYDDSLASLTVRAMRIYMLSFLICGYNMFCSAWFTALNNGVVSAVVAFSRTLIFELGCIFVLPMILEIDGIWLSVNVAEVLALILSISLILGFRRRYDY